MSHNAGGAVRGNWQKAGMLRQLASNTAVGLVGTVALKGLAFVTTLVLARGLGGRGFGIYSFVGVYIFFFGFIVDLGIERVVTRELSAAPERHGRLLGNAIILKLGLSAVAVPAACVVAWLMGLDIETRYCIAIAAAGLPLSLDLLFRSYFQSQYQVKYIYAVSLPGSLFFLLLTTGCVYWSLPVHDIFYAGLFNAGLTLALLMIVAMPRIRLSFVPERALIVTLLRDAGEVGLFVLLFMFAMRIDQLLLFNLRGAAEVGRYAVAVRVTEALSILPEAVMLTVFPVLAATHHSQPRRFQRTYHLSFKFLSAIILPGALLFTVLREPFVRLVFGAEYLESAVPLAVLAWGMFFAYTGAVYLNLFIVRRLQRLMLVVSAVTVTVNIAVNLWLIPQYGATGAALATVASNVVGYAVWALHPVTAPFMKECTRTAARPLASVMVAWLIVALVGVRGAAAGAVVLPVYVALMWLFGGITRTDVDLVRRLLVPEPTA